MRLPGRGIQPGCGAGRRAGSSPAFAPGPAAGRSAPLSRRPRSRAAQGRPRAASCPVPVFHLTSLPRGCPLLLPPGTQGRRHAYGLPAALSLGASVSQDTALLPSPLPGCHTSLLPAQLSRKTRCPPLSGRVGARGGGSSCPAATSPLSPRRDLTLPTVSSKAWPPGTYKKMSWNSGPTGGGPGTGTQESSRAGVSGCSSGREDTRGGLWSYGGGVSEAVPRAASTARRRVRGADGRGAWSPGRGCGCGGLCPGSRVAGPLWPRNEQSRGQRWASWAPKHPAGRRPGHHTCSCAPRPSRDPCRRRSREAWRGPEAGVAREEGPRGPEPGVPHFPAV